MAIATLLVGSALSSYADRVSQEEAQVIASEFLSIRTGKSADRLQLTALPGSENNRYTTYSMPETTVVL